MVVAKKDISDKNNDQNCLEEIVNLMNSILNKIPERYFISQRSSVIKQELVRDIRLLINHLDDIVLSNRIISKICVKDKMFFDSPFHELFECVYNDSGCYEQQILNEKTSEIDKYLAKKSADNYSEFSAYKESLAIYQKELESSVS